MDQDVFMEVYFRELGAKAAEMGYSPELMIKALIAGLKSMIKNDGTMTNEDRFWDTASEIMGASIREHIPDFQRFYENEFRKVKQSVTPTPLAAECINMLKEKGYRLVLATNAIFPRVATLERIKWAGLNPADFELITTYENFRYTKPNLNYYKVILETIKKDAQDCIMIGNDVREDMCVTELGMDTFLVTDWIINQDQVDISTFRQGTFADLHRFIQELPTLK